MKSHLTMERPNPDVQTIMELAKEFTSQFQGRSEQDVRLLSVCEAGNLSSQDMVLIAQRYRTGQGIPNDDARAVAWYRKSAEMQNPSAMACLALCYLVGLGVPKDPSSAITWLGKCADLGSTIAMYTIANCYEKGIHVGKDIELAIQWYRRTIDHGCLDYSDNLIALLSRERGDLATIRYLLDAHDSYPKLGRNPYRRLIDDHMKGDHGIETLRDWRRLQERERQLMSEVETLRADNERMSTELLYQPGGAGYREAMSDFTDRVSASASASSASSASSSASSSVPADDSL